MSEMPVCSRFDRSVCTQSHLQSSFALFRDGALQQGRYWEEQLTVVGKPCRWAQLQALHLYTAQVLTLCAGSSHSKWLMQGVAPSTGML